LSTIVRILAWLWMAIGFAATALVALTEMGVLRLAVMVEVAMVLAFPWSEAIAFLRLGPWMAVLTMALGVFVNGQILFAVGNVLKD